MTESNFITEQLNNFNDNNTNSCISNHKNRSTLTKTASNSTISNTRDFSNKEMTSPPEQPERIPTIFEWKGSNENVYLTGSFCNWKHKLKMHFLHHSSRLTLGLPRGKYLYKFIVDGSWQYSEHHPVCVDQGVVNNEIDTTNVAFKAKNEEKQPIFEPCPLLLPQNNHSNSNRKNAEQRTVIPCPDVFASSFDLDKHDGRLPNVFSNHGLIPALSSKNDRNVVIVSTQRVRLKNMIMMYYKPKGKNIK